MRLTQGWNGRFFEDFQVRDVYEHALGRAVTATDNAWFTLLTQNTAPLHFDQHYASQTEFGRPLVNSAFTIALVTRQSVSDVSQNVMANLGWEEVRLPNPLFEGDTVYSRSEVIDTRESRSRPNVGIATVRTTGFTQDGTPVITFRRTVMVYRRSQGPSIPKVAFCRTRAGAGGGHRPARGGRADRLCVGGRHCGGERRISHSTRSPTWSGSGRIHRPAASPRAYRTPRLVRVRGVPASDHNISHSSVGVIVQRDAAGV